MEKLKLTLIGFILGITMTIPGISAATMAVVFNVYERLIGVIVPNVKKLLAAWVFWLPLAVGGFVGIIFASRALTTLFENHRIPTYWFLIGVILGSIPLVWRRVLEQNSKLPSPTAAIFAVIAFGLMVLMAISGEQASLSLASELTLTTAGLLMLSGALGALAMIIPGISGAFLLLVIGMYETVLAAVSNFNIPFIALIVVGALLGLLLGAAFVRFLLKKAPKLTYGAVLGFVAGSTIVLFPGSFGQNTIGIIVSASVFACGFALSFIMGRKESPK